MKKYLIDREINVTSVDFFALINSFFFLIMCVFVYYDRFVMFRGAANIHEFFIYATVIFLVIFFFWYKFKHLSVNSLVLVLIEIGILIHFSGAFIEVDGHRLYDSRFFDIRYDKYVHFFNSMIALFITLHIFAKKGLPQTNIILMVAVLTVLGLGAVVEIIEFLVTLTVENNGVGSYNNNMLDLTANLFGAVSAVLLHEYLLKDYVFNK